MVQMEAILETVIRISIRPAPSSAQSQRRAERSRAGPGGSTGKRMQPRGAALVAPPAPAAERTQPRQRQRPGARLTAAPTEPHSPSPRARPAPHEPAPPLPARPRLPPGPSAAGSPAGSPPAPQPRRRLTPRSRAPPTGQLRSRPSPAPPAGGRRRTCAARRGRGGGARRAV